MSWSRAARRGVARAVDATGDQVPPGRRAAPMADARAFASRTALFGGEYDYRHRGPQDHCGLSFNISVAGCQVGGGGAPVLPPPLARSL